MQTRPVIGPIRLITGDLRRTAAFYRAGIGLEILSGDSTEPNAIQRLGKNEIEMVVLEERPGAVQPGRTTGLFHMAILLPSRKALARQLKHFIDAGVPIHGASDHGVSEAIYLSDPDGNGIEIYSDLPREAWVFKGGQIQMGTLALDVADLLKEISDSDEPWIGMPVGTVMGHIHLRVADLATAEAFYHDVIGMDVTARYGNAATFMSFDGYHHHLGINTWESKGAPPAPDGSIGLKNFQIDLPSGDALARVQSRATAKNIPTEILPHGISLRDPSGNRLTVRN
jgi:catechol 2,3-dioxygenase